MDLRKYTGACLASLVFFSASAFAAPSLVADLTPGQLPGTTITFTVDEQPADSFLRLQVAKTGQPLRVIYDYTAVDALKWTPMEDGVYAIVMTIRESTGQQVVGGRFFIRGAAQPLVRPTRHPQVALYHTPACFAGLSMRVSYNAVGATGGQLTNTLPCDGAASMNFYVAGMLQETDYEIRHQILSPIGTVIASGPVRNFTSGTAADFVPTATIIDPADANTSSEGVVMFGTAASAVPSVYAIDLEGNSLWYYESPNEGETGVTFTRPTSNGNVMVIGAATPEDRFRVREIDLAGNTVRETNARRLAEQFTANGGTSPLTTMHHEARVLENGQILVLAHSEVIRPQGGETVDVLSDIILGLDENMQVIWQWDAFDHLDINQVAILGETCVPNGPGCPQLFLDEIANDWLHSNAIGYRDSDGAIMLSIRHQDASVAIDYANGLGTGTVIWNLGKLGDFTLQPDPNTDLFQSHQHDNNFLGADQVLLYDNGNAANACVAGTCTSFGKHYQLDETNMTATLIKNFPLPEYSGALGSAQLLENGNYHFNSGIIQPATTGRSDELAPDGSLVYSVRFSSATYRTVRMFDLYTAPVYEQQ